MGAKAQRKGIVSVVVLLVLLGLLITLAPRITFGTETDAMADETVSSAAPSASSDGGVPLEAQSDDKSITIDVTAEGGEKDMADALQKNQGKKIKIVFRLVANVSVTQTIEIPAGQTVTFNLNDHCLVGDGLSGAVIHVQRGAILTINDGVFGMSTIEGGNNSESGGGIVNEGTLIIVGTAIQKCHSDKNGGAIYNAGTLKTTNLYVLDNTAQDNGGGIYNANKVQSGSASDAGTATIAGGLIKGNEVLHDGEDTWTMGQGGGVYNSGEMILRDVTISENTSVAGGGFTNNYSDDASSHASVIQATATISHCEISKNTSRASGGGIFVGNGYEPENYTKVAVTIEKNTRITKNQAGKHGGGIYASYTTAFLLDSSSVTDNVSNSNGGGIYLYSRHEGQLHLKGKVVVRDNKQILADNNLYLRKTEKAIVVDGALEDGSHINFLTDWGELQLRQLSIGYSDAMGNADPASYFHPESEGYSVFYKAGEVWYSEDVPYIDYVDGVRTPSVRNDYKVISVTKNNLDNLNSKGRLESGWYVCAVQAKVQERVWLYENADVHIILINGCNLHLEHGLAVCTYSTHQQNLSIYGQEGDEGIMYAGTEGWGAGIGGVYSHGDSIALSPGNITIYGGTVTAEGNGGAGIGSGYYYEPNYSASKRYPDRILGSYTQWGGVVTAIADASQGSNDAGLGGGCWCGNMPITINGGTLTAKGGDGAAGIGAGYASGLQGDITINGGHVTAIGGKGGVGIGWCGINGSSTTKVIVRGGTVETSTVDSANAIYHKGDGLYLCGGTVHGSSNSSEQIVASKGVKYGIDPHDATYKQGYRVLVGSSASDAKPVLAAERDNACNNTEHDHSYVCIEPCTDHEYVFDEETGLATCKWCDEATPYHTVTFTPGIGTGETTTMRVVEGVPFKLLTAEEAGYSLSAGHDLRTHSSWMAEGDDTIYHLGAEVTVTKDTTFVAQWSLTWAELQNYIDMAYNKASIHLPCDVTATETDQALVIPAGKQINLDLNGFTLNRNLSAPVEPTDTSVSPGSVIVVEGTLILTGGTTCGGNATTGGGIYVADGGAVTHYDGLVTNNKATTGGGVYVAKGGSYTLKGGEVVDNAVSKDGGGVYVADGGTFTMDGVALIQNNDAAGNGGGVCVSGGTFEMVTGTIASNTAKGNGGGAFVESGTFSMNAVNGGCELTGNHAHKGGGVYVSTGSTYELGGYPTMSGNTVDSPDGDDQESADGNICLQNGALIDMASTFIPSGTIGVSVEDPPAAGASRVLTDRLGGFGTYESFTSQNDGYKAGKDIQGEAILGTPVVVSFDAGKGTGEMDSVEVATGSGYVLPESEFIAPYGLDFLGWLTADDAADDTEPRGVGSAIEVTSDVTLTAQYGKIYDLWVNDVRVTSGNCQDVLGDGTVVYSPKTNTLHLDNPPITTGYRGDGANIYSEDMDLIVTGAATLDTGAECGIYVRNGDLTLGGDFTIAGEGRGIFANNITLTDGTISVEVADKESGFGIAVIATKKGGIVIEDGVERVEVQATHPLYGRDKSITLGDRLYIEEPVDGSVLNRFGVMASIVDAEGNELDHVVIVPYHVDGKKTWADSSGSQTTDHSPVTVRLMGDGKELASKTVSEADGWAWSFEVPYASEGRRITYTLTEDALPDYVAEVDGFDVTNTYQVGKTYVNVTAAWDDDNNRDGVRPASTVVRLLADGEDTGETLTLSANNNWTGTFSDLPTKKDGKDLAYTVAEDVVAQYETTIAGDATKGFTLTNTHTLTTVDVPVSKVWDDSDNQDGKRPDYVVVRLLASGAEVDTAVLTADGSWTHTFKGLLKYANGEPIDYALTEDAVSDYTTKITGGAADGFTVTNTHTPEAKTIDAVKTWEDGANADGIRPESVTLTLTGTVTDDGGTATKVYGEAATTTDDLASWTVPVYHAGTAIEYTVAETDAAGASTVPEGYEAAVSGFSVANSHTPETVSTAGKLTWDDSDNRDGIRPSSVTVHLLESGDVLDSQVVEPDADGVWAWDFGERIKRAGGEEIAYTITVDEVEGYAFTQAEDSFDITGAHQYATVDVLVSISWEDEGNRDGVRPEGVTVHLLGNGEEVSSKALPIDEGEWSTTFEDLPKNADGKEIVYTVTEDEIAGYDFDVSMSDPSDEDNTIKALVTNTHAIETVDVTGTITWDDDGDRDAMRPSSIMVNLMYGSSVYARRYVEPNDEGEWTFTFSGQTKNEAGQPIHHVLSVDHVRGYTFTQEQDGYSIVAKHTFETVDVKGSKTWDDVDDQDGIRPDNVTVTLTGTVPNGDDDGTREVFSNTKTVTNGLWQWAAPRYEKGEEITYTIAETDGEGSSTVPQGYEVEVDNFDIVNTHTPEMIDIEASKIWEDGDNQDGLRPKDVTVHLLADGAKVDTAILSEAGSWKHTFEGLPKCAGGKEIVYTLSEDEIEGYSATATGSATEGLVITNTHIPETRTIAGAASWDDGGNRDGIRPESLTVRLMSGETEVANQVVEPDADGTWAWSFDNQPVYAAGVVRTYTLVVDGVEGYTCEVDGFDATLTHEPARVDTTVVIQWDDNNDQDGIRPEKLFVNLKRNGRPFGSMTVSYRSWWTTTVGGLYRYENGQELTYTWEEMAVPEGYDLSSSEVSGSTTTLTFTHKPETIDTSVQLHWVDGSDAAGLRPASVNVNLMRNGVLMGTYILSAKNDWSTSAKDLPVYGDYVYRYTWSVVDGDWYDDYLLSNIERSSTRFDYTYTLTGTTSYTVTKVWDDDGNRDGERPESVTVMLLRDNRRTFKDVVLSEGNGWTYTWEGLSRYDGDSGEIAYSVAEESVEDYALTTEASDNGATLTNTHRSGTRTISVAAAWLDGGDAAGARPESLQVTLVAKANGSEVVLENATQTLNTNNGWSYQWSGLPVNDAGSPIEYSLEPVVAPEGYKIAIGGSDDSGFVVTGTLLGDVSVTKVWDDDGDRDGLRPETLVVQLTANGTATSNTATLTESEGWTATVAEPLPLYGANGSKIVYSWKEGSVPEGYELTSTETVDLATTLTNTHEPAETEATVSVIEWADGDDRDGLRPQAVDVTLLGAGSKPVGTASLSEANDWTVTLSNLPKYDKGVPIAYAWVQSFDGLGSAYTASTDVEGTKTTFTNTHVVERVDLQVTKVWHDDGDRLELRPERLTVALLSNGEKTGKTVVLDGESGWTATIEGQPVNEAGKPISYTWVETSMSAGYELASAEVDDSGHATTLINELKLTEASVAIVWDDADNADGLRPESIVASLSNDSEVSLTGEDDWQATKGDLPMTDDTGEEITYAWKLNKLPSGYQLTRTRVSGTRTTFTLKHTPEKTSVSVTKVWSDNDDQDGLRPRRVTVHLHAGGADTGQKLTLSGSNGWTATFDDLLKHAAGKEIAYTVTEDAVEGYTGVITGTAANGFTLINKHEPETIDVGVTKTWNDDDDRDGKRPAQVAVNLLANGSKYVSATLAEADDWKTSFDDLPKRAGGKEIAYTLTEEAVDGYTAIVAGDATQGFIVTNVHAADTVTVAGSLTWNDANDQDGLRPKSVTIHLLGNGGEVAQLVVKPDANGAWTWDFGALPKNASGSEIMYTLSVDEVEDYAFEAQGYDLTGTHAAEMFAAVGVTKTWADADDQDGLRPEGVTVRLLADGKEAAVTTLTEVDGWQASFENQPVYANGKRIAYTLIEDEVEGYASAVTGDATTGFTVTNTHTPKILEIKGAKEWRDENNQDGLRPENVTVTLRGTVTGDEGAIEVCDKTVTTRNDRWLWKEPAYYKGKKIDYVVTETDEAGVSTVPEGYDATVDGFNITNTHMPATVDVAVTKVWEDADNQDGLRPEGVTVRLLADGETVDSVELTGKGGWTATFKGLPVYESGKEIEYTLDEVEVEGYESAVTGSVVEGFIVTNTHAPQMREIEGSKTWDDANNQDGIRPESVTVTLTGAVADDEGGDSIIEFSSNTVETSDGSWRWTVPMFHEGRPVSYSVTETDAAGNSTVPDGYEAKNKGFNITNVHVPETVDVTVTKVWDDANDEDGLRPEGVTVRLWEDGEEIGSAKLSDKGGWKHTFENLPRYSSGVEITYTVTEDEVEGYTCTVTGDASWGFTVTNKHVPVPKMVVVAGGLTWDDDDDHDGLRPEDVTVHLLADGVEVASLTVAPDADGAWTWDFGERPESAGGQKIAYTLVVDEVEGYVFEQRGFDLTASHEDATVDITVTKDWEDADDHDGLRPGSVTVHLLADGEKVALTTLTEADGWQASFENLPKYANGVEIAYTVTEDEVEGYESTVTGDAATGFFVTNTHVPVFVDVHVSKVWDDDDNNDGMRPESVTVHLLANDEEVGAATLTEADAWQVVFEDMPTYARGKEIAYTLSEDDVEGYAVTVAGSEAEDFTVTNTHTDELVAVAANIVWDDENNVDGKRPEHVTVRLLANGTEAAAATLTEADGWSANFENLPKYSNGVEISYKLDEVEVEGYSTTVTGDAATGFIVTNTHTPEMIAITGSVVWDDGGNQDGKRPASIMIRLLADGVEIGAIETSEAEGWSWLIDGLPKYENGKEIAYAVVPDALEGHDIRITRNDDGSYTITNVHVPETVSVSMRGTWNDSDNQDGLRPVSTTVRLMADGSEVTSVELSSENDWVWRSDEFPKYAAGQEIAYSAEVVLGGIITGDNSPGTYAAAVAGNLQDGFEITYTYTPTEEPDPTPPAPGTDDATYSITYQLNGGSFDGSTADIVEEYANGTTISIHAAPMRDGYTFLYWKGSEFHPGDTYKVEGDHTFVAQWEKNGGSTPGGGDRTRPNDDKGSNQTSGGGSGRRGGGLPETGDVTGLSPVLVALSGLALIAIARVRKGSRRN